MALENYTDLLNAINGAAGWLHRTDLADIAPTWISLAEVTMNYGDLEVLGIDGLRTGAQETIGTLSTTGGTQTVALPTDHLETRKIYYNLSGTRFELVEAPAIPIRLNESSNVQAPPTTYITTGSNLYLIPIPDQTYTITIDYYAKIGPLTASNSTNWLMTMSPMTYLAGAIYHGSLWFGNKFDQTKWAGAFKASMSQVARADAQRRFRNTRLRSEVAGLQNRPFSILTG